MATSFVQRRLQLGYRKARLLIDSPIEVTFLDRP
jgi:hypothetical protein